MQLIPNNRPQPTEAERIAAEMLDGFNAAFRQLVDNHRRFYLRFWSSSTTPDEILETMGTDAIRMVQVAGQNVGNMHALAAIMGKSIDDFLPPEFYAPRREFVVETADGQPTGRVTLAPPADGHDAWGNPPPPEPELEPDPIDEP